MSQNKQKPAAAETEPTIAAGGGSAWPFVLLGVILFGCFLHVETTGGAFRADVYAERCWRTAATGGRGASARSDIDSTARTDGGCGDDSNAFAHPSMRSTLKPSRAHR